MWKGSSDLTKLTLRAVQCGIDIQSKLDKYDSNEGFSLTLHIGVGSGDLLSLWCGGIEDSFEYLVSGEPLAQLRTAVDNAKAGEVAVSSAAWNLIKSYCDGEPVEEDYKIINIHKGVPVLSLDTIKGWPRVDAEPVLRCFIPLAVQVSVDSQHNAGWQNELRSATILFVKLNTPIESNDEQEYLSKIHSVLCCMQQVIFKYRGMIRQFLADDKGTVLIAAFGVPPLSHFDDPIRGIKSGLDIHRELSKLGMDCSIGVTTGQVFCGSVGSEVRQEYAMVGDTVNLSARLMMAAFKQDKKLLCDKTTYERSKNSVNFNELTPIIVKGKKNPVSIYSPAIDIDEIAVPKRLNDRKYLTNRPEVIQLIKDKLQQLVCDYDHKNSKIGSLAIIGEQGMGKSLVINEVIRLAIDENILICSSIPDGFQREEPLLVFSSIISDILGITKVQKDCMKFEFDSELLAKKLKELFDNKNTIDLLPLLNIILPLKFPETNITKNIPSSERYEVLSKLLLQIFKKISKQLPFIITIEDVHLLDNYSKSLLQNILTSIPSILVVFTASTHGQILEYSEIPKLVYIKLEPFSEDDSIHFVESELGVNSIPIEIQNVLKKAQGNPYLLSEISRSIFESESIIIEDKKCKIIGDLQALDLTRISSIINSTMDRFSAAQQMVLKVASVIGFCFDLETLIQIFPSGENQKKFLKRELDELCRDQVIIASNIQEGEEEYEFTNKSFLDVVHERLTFAQRYHLHLHIAQWYEKTRQNQYAKLAYHWTEVVESTQHPTVEQICKAIKYLRVSGPNRLWYRKAISLSELLPSPKKEIIQKELSNDISTVIERQGKTVSTLDLRKLAGVSLKRATKS